MEIKDNEMRNVIADESIRSFRGEYAFLSNFYECDVEYDGVHYKNSEAAFQAQKCMDPDDRVEFADLTGKVAKRKGRRVKLRNDWNEIKYSVMKEIVRAKFDQNPELAEKLLATGNAKLEERNTWGDRTWGIDVRTGVGKNYLGVILMDIRDELRK